jgi:flagellar protein FlaG
MDFNLPPIGGGDRTGGAAPVPRPRAADKDFPKVLAEAGDVRNDAIPATPPPEAHAEVERASARYDELRSQGRELHFNTDHESGRLVIEVRDLDGNVIRTVPPSKALDVISGENPE